MTKAQPDGIIGRNRLPMVRGFTGLPQALSDHLKPCWQGARDDRDARLREPGVKSRKIEMFRKTIHTAVAAAAVLSFTVAAGAQGRPDARAMSCEQVQLMILDRGAVVLTTGQHTYDRYVASTFFCSHPYVAQPDSIATRDGWCPVLRCGYRLFEDRW